MNKRAWIGSGLTDVRAGEVHTLGLRVRIEDAAVRAGFVARKLRRFCR